jgi:hypothetical protein
MRLQVLVVILLVAVAAAFALLNRDAVTEPRSVYVPGVEVSGPVLGVTLLAAVGALVLMLVVHAADGIARNRVHRGLVERLARREQEIALLKSAAYDRVGGTVEALHRELSRWMETERRRHQELQEQIAALRRSPEPRLLPTAEPEPVVVPPVPADREAA